MITNQLSTTDRNDQLELTINSDNKFGTLTLMSTKIVCGIVIQHWVSYINVVSSSEKKYYRFDKYCNLSSLIPLHNLSVRAYICYFILVPRLRA